MMGTMSVKSREKIALVVFLGLIVLSLCGLGWYLLAGHSWNVAASNLDDTFGSMDGYTAIVYPGTAVEAEAEASADGGKPSAKGASKKAADAAGTSGSADAVDFQDDAASTDAATGSGAAQEPRADDGKPASDEPASEAGADAAAAGSVGDGPAAGAATSSGVAGSTDGSLAPKKKALSVAEAKEGYEDKGATVFSLDTVDLGAYSEGVILKKGGHRFGVFSIGAPTSSIVLEKQIAYFKRYKVDFIVLVTPDKEYAEGVAGIDIVVSTQDEDLFVMGETIDGTFYVDAPAVGSVGAILISPSNVVSAKVLQAA